MQDGEPIEHKYTSKAIENAQKKVEAHNFEIRKHLIEFDDVMNKQREVVYSQRKFILSGSDLKLTVFEMIEDLGDDIVRRFSNEKTHFEDWDITALTDALYAQFGIKFELERLPAWRLLVADPSFMQSDASAKKERLLKFREQGLISSSNYSDLLTIFRPISIASPAQVRPAPVPQKIQPPAQQDDDAIRVPNSES